jgi:predicted aspartyl protease
VGVTYLDVTVKRLAEDPAAETVHFLVDTGATYTVAPSSVLTRLGIKPHREVTLSLADGSQVHRQMGGAYFEYGGVGGMAPVLFGAAEDAELLGVTTLEAMGYMVDPLSRDLRRLPAMLGGLAA